MQQHIPVLLSETLKLLAPKAGDRILDVTLGLGGHSVALLENTGTTGSLVALDADAENIAIASERLKKFRSPVTIIHSNFSLLPDCLPEHLRSFDVILADLGLSSPHIDDPSRGFMFRAESPLDMRFDRSCGMTAALLLASLDSFKLLRIFQELGEIPNARRFTEAIIARRKDSPVRTSKDLVETADFIYGYKAPHYLPQIFQALRMAVNGEREALLHLLSLLPSLLSPGGRCAIISYHSLEDAAVKSVFRSLCTGTKDAFTGAIAAEPAFALLTKKPIMPSEEEISRNPRSRSGRLRAIVKREAYTSGRTA